MVYGLLGLKTHAKMALVVRRELDGLRRYVHLSTGNYNATTAKMYTDLGLFTCNDEIGVDVSNIFNYLTGYSKQTDFNKLLVAPINLREKLLDLVEREVQHVRAGHEGRIVMKLNSIVDPVFISALYEASNAGVKIDLIVRGICCLIPGKIGLSENIRVTSIVGRFLEHSRIFYFENNGEFEIFLSSADIMQRNLDRRVEIAFPILDERIKKQLKEIILKVMLMDNQKARVLTPNGTYAFAPIEEEQKLINSQEWFMKNSTKPPKKLAKKLSDKE